MSGEDNPWIAHDGGKAPVARTVQVKFRDGEVSGPTAPRFWVWAHFDNPGDIIAYRLLPADGGERGRQQHPAPVLRANIDSIGERDG